MRNYLIFIFLFLFFNNFVVSQHMIKPSQVEISTLPLWAKKMYAENPNVFEIDGLYAAYYRENPFVKSYHTKFYKRWRREINNRINTLGYVIEITENQKQTIELEYLAKQVINKSSNWSVVGPILNTEGNGTQGSGQANIYSLDQCASNPTMMFAGTEPGEVYKSTDAGQNWSQSSKTIDFGSGVSAIEVHPTNPNIVFAGGNLGVFRSTDGGNTWTNVLPQSNFNVNEILINPEDDQLILVASEKGLFRSINGGTSWIQLFTERSYDVKTKPGNAAIVYLVKNNSNLGICQFSRSSDYGLTWELQSNGWFNSTDPGRNDGGARIAVTPADPERIYAYLIGEAKTDDAGFIGVYRSNDGGSSWGLQNGPAGGPYTPIHQNLAYGYPDWTYHQGFYNCAITASHSNADQILIGGLNLWRSNDGGATFSSVSGYIGGPLSMHVDMQDFRTFGDTTWVTTDGGIYFSTDFFNSDPQFRMKGLHGSDYWGFGSGWNEDVLVGGLYHNGNLAHSETYSAGVFLELGGGEAPTGYVNPGNNRKTYFSDIGGKYIPVNINDPVTNFSIGKSPNESYWSAESSEMEFHPNCFSIAYLGKDNNLWKTIDGGVIYNLVHSFGTNVDNQVKYIEISSSNPNVIYLNQQAISGTSGTLWKTIDEGLTWTSIPIPAGNSRRMLLTIDPRNENNIWIAYPDGSNGNKVFYSSTGGTSWVNITSPLLNNESIQSIVHIAGLNKALYVGTDKAIYYRNQAAIWSIDNAGLPTYTSTNILRPFYRDGKIRLASYGKGIWESNLNESPTQPIARIMVDKLEQTYFCAVDSFYFEDHSFINHANATWSWSFPTGSPSLSNQRNPAVLFTSSGTHLAILKITDAAGNQAIDSVKIEVNAFTAPSTLQEDFQTVFLPDGWFQTTENGSGLWELNTAFGGFGNSSQSAIFDNYNTYSDGEKTDLNIPLNTQQMSQLNLSFEVAYAPWGNLNSDTLLVLVSTDCGQTFTQLYRKGGDTLATAPAFQGLFEPTPTQWRTETINLNSYVGIENILVAFRNIGHYGNALYLDNINILSDLAVKGISIDKPSMYPNPVNAGKEVKLKWENQTMKVKISDVNGKEILRQSGKDELNILIPSKFSAGMYTVNIETKTKIVNLKLLVNL